VTDEHLSAVETLDGFLMCPELSLDERPGRDAWQ